MATFVKISDLTEKTTLAGTEEVLINDSGTSKKMTTQRFLNVQTACEAAQTAAELAETNAETAETNAAASASAASSSASAASSSASAASSSASSASSSATAASNAQSAAETARDQTLTAFDSFDDRYLGTKSSDPSVDNDGNALVAGALYFNSTAGEMKVYDGSNWLAAYASLSGALLATNNLSDLNNAATARTNLGLGTAATTASTDYATAAQGALADSALQDITGESIESLSDVAAMTPSDGQLLTWDSATSKWNAEDAPISLPSQTGNSGKYLTTNGTSASWDALATVANSGAYSDLSGTPTNVSTFTNDSGYLTGNQTITLSGDVSGSGTTSIAVTVADDSHNHVISNVDGLQTELDGKSSTSHNHTLDGLSNTTITSNTSGEILKWNGSAWINNTLAEAGIQPAGSYLTGNQTITLSGDATGSGTTSISVTVADDSHNHSTSTITGLGTLATLSSVNAATITDNSVGAAELNVSGNGTTSQYLRSDGDGTFTWATPTNTTYSAGSGLDLSGTTFSIESDLRDNVQYIGRDSNDYIYQDGSNIRFYINGAEDWRMVAGGAFHADGDVIAYSATISDERLKTDIKTIDNALDMVNNMRGVTFTYKKDGKQSAGVVAQELEKIFPRAISETQLPLKADDDKEYKVVQYDQLHGVLIEAIKELTARVKELESK